MHNGYFSIDKKGGWTKTVENNQDNRRQRRDDAYNLIMRDKEKLLSFETPLKFIFSHSALREGWDNPNVFQICTLRDIRTERERRQTIGRGLRLCVNQDGERLRGFEVNTLTVIATESYEQFAENLQKEIEEDTGIRFGIVEQHQFAAIAVTDADGHDRAAGLRAVEGAVGAPARRTGYIDAKGKVQDSLKKALKDGTLTLPEPFAAQLGQITEMLRKLAGRLEIKNADERRQVQTAAGGAAQRGVQGAVGPHQAQDHLPRAVRQREADRELHQGAAGRAAHRQDPPAMAQGRHRHRQGGRGGHRDARAPRPSCWTRATSSCPIC